MSTVKRIVIAILISILIYIVIPMLVVYGVEKLESKYYQVGEGEITRVLPKTKVDTFKGNFNVSKSDVKIYKSVNDETEITQGEIGTGMILKYAGSEEAYKISVIGDLDKDSKITDIELNLLIRNVVGIDTLTIQDVLEKSSDINKDGKIDHIDITLMIRYIVYGELEVEEAKDPKAPIIEVEGEEGKNGYYVGDVTVKVEKAEGETAQIEKITYKINNGSEEEVPASGEIIIIEEGEYTVKGYIYGVAGGKIEGESKEIKIEKDVGRIEIKEKVTAETIEVEIETGAISGISRYKYSIGKENSTGQIEYLEEKESTSGEIKFEGLEENTRYIVKVEVESNAGNTGSTTKEIVTTEGADSTAPEITITVGEVTTNSIEITVSSSDSESGMPNNPVYYIYIREKGETNYIPIHDGTETYFIFTKLKQGTEYEIKVTTRDNTGNEGEAVVIVTTKIVPEAGGSDSQVGAIIVNGPIWENRKAKVTLSTQTEFTIQYQVNGTNGEWIEGTEITELVHGDTIYARLWDGTNAGEAASLKIEDKISPKVTVNAGNITTNSIEVTVRSEDNETGLASTPSYTYYIKKNIDSTYQEIFTGTETQYTFTGLEQETEYDIKVTVKDIAENEGEGLITIVTNKMGGDISGEGEDLSTGNGLIKVTGPTWENKEASISLSTQTGLTIQYQVNTTTGKWTDGTEVSGLHHADKVYARLWDGTNAGGLGYFIIQDTIKPIITVDSGKVTTNSIAVSLISSDEESGIPNNPKYVYYIKKNTESTYTEIYRGSGSEYTYEMLAQETTYNIKVSVEDAAGNIGEGTTIAKTEKIWGTDSNPSGITKGNTMWNNGVATVTLSTTTDLRIQYQINGTSGSWIEGSTVTGLKHNNVIYARLWDGINAGTIISFTILDTDMPTASITLETTQSEIRMPVAATIKQEDDESGIEIRNCRWAYNTRPTPMGTTNPGAYIGGGFVNTEETIDLIANAPGIYYLHVLTVDVAGNKIETISDPITVNVATVQDINLEDYVQYNEGNITKWKVLLEENNIQIDSANVPMMSTYLTEEYTLGLEEKFGIEKEETEWNRFMNNYNNYISTLKVIGGNGSEENPWKLSENEYKEYNVNI